MSTAAAYTVPIHRVQEIVGLAAARGWDIDELLATAGISPVLLSEGQSRVTVEQTAALARLLWRQTDDEFLGFGLAPLPRGSFRLLCYALLGSADIRAALRRYGEINRGIPGFPSVRVTVTGGLARLSYDIAAVERPVELLVDILLSITHRFLSWAVGSRIPLHGVEVPYAALPGVDDYDLIFGTPVTFSAPTPALVFPESILESRIVRDESSMSEFLREAPMGVLTDREYAASVANQVRTLLQQGPTGEWPSVADLAGALAMSPQTLRRKLSEEGTSPRAIREQILRDAAIASLVQGEETIAALSRRLGFSEPSAFSRAFRRWTGSPPGAYQR